MENEQIQLGPLAREYIAAVRAGRISKAATEIEVEHGAAYILRHGIQ